MHSRHRLHAVAAGTGNHRRGPDAGHRADLTTLRRLRELGVRVAMDDFGTGYSSLGYLLKFRFDKIKIDRSFISRLAQDDNTEAIVRAVIGISQSFGGSKSTPRVWKPRPRPTCCAGWGVPKARAFSTGRPISGELFDLLVPQGAAKDHHAGVSSTPSAATATDVTKARVGITSAHPTARLRQPPGCDPSRAYIKLLYCAAAEAHGFYTRQSLFPSVA